MKTPPRLDLDPLSPIGDNGNRYKVLETATFRTWLNALRDKLARKVIQTRLDRMQLGHFGDVETLGGGVSEMRVHAGPGYRLYFAQHGGKIVILLAGGDKDSQRRDIRDAKAQWQTLRHRLEAPK